MTRSVAILSAIHFESQSLYKGQVVNHYETHLGYMSTARHRQLDELYKKKNQYRQSLSISVPCVKVFVGRKLNL